jgi:NRAMP (natural resistance-associated macrophage protein)-like metal ion transporter
LRFDSSIELTFSLGIYQLPTLIVITPSQYIPPRIYLRDQEVVGTALALSLLSKGALPLWAGVAAAAVTAYLLLLTERWGFRHLEFLLQGMVGVMSLAMGTLFFAADVPYAEVAKGLIVPRLTAGALPTACALVGEEAYCSLYYLEGISWF